MMSKCANPACSSAFRYLRDGKLFQVPFGSIKSSDTTTPACDEFFWLCGSCSKDLTIVVDPIEGVRTVPRHLPRVMRAAS